MPNPTDTLIESDLTADPPLVQDAAYRFTPADREYIDKQNRAVQRLIVKCLIKGVHGTFFRLAGSSAAVLVGDTVCAASLAGQEPTVTKSTSGDLAEAKAAIGVVILSASPGSFVFVATAGMVSPDITGLVSGSPGSVRVNTSTGRCERVSSLSSADYPLGSVDNAGWMHISAIPAGAVGSASVADDIAKSTGTTIDRVQGFRGRPLDATAPLTRQSYQYDSVSDTHKPKYGGNWVINARDVGLIPTLTDNTTRAANTAALQAMLDGVALNGGNQGRIAVYIPGGEYYFAATGIVVRRQVHWFGDGSQATILHFPVSIGRAAVSFQYGGVTIGGGGDTGDSSFSVMTDMTIQGSNPSPAYTDIVNPGTDHGIFFQSAVLTFRHIRVLNFNGDGFRTDAGIGIPLGFNTSSDQSRLDHCFSGQNAGWGLNIHDGDDNNAILVTSFFAQSNAAGDINESSFLGNTYTGGGSHSESGGFKVTGESNGTSKSLFLGVYFEGPELSRIDGGDTCVGGGLAVSALRYPDNGGLILGSDGCANVSSVHYKHSDAAWTAGATIAVNDHIRPTLSKANGRRYKATAIGSAPHHTGGTEPVWPHTFGGTTATVVDGDITWIEDGVLATALDWTASLDKAPFAHSVYDYTAPTPETLGWVRTKGLLGGWPNYWWGFGASGDLGQENSYACFLSTADSATSHAYTGRGILGVPKLMLGTPFYGQIFMDAFSAPAVAPGAGTRTRGDVRLNTTPGIGTQSGWACVTAGNPGTWQPIGYVQSSFYDITPQAIAKWIDTAATEGTAAAPKMGVRARRRQIQTTTATANQVIEDGGTFGGEDFSLPDNAITRVEATLLVKKNGSAAGGTIEMKADYYRDAAGAPTLIGSATINYNLVGATLDATTANFNVNGNKVELRVSPESADTLDWRLVRTQFEGTS